MFVLFSWLYSFGCILQRVNDIVDQVVLRPGVTPSGRDVRAALASLCTFRSAPPGLRGGAELEIIGQACVFTWPRQV
jgi:hypothetical protein